MLLWKWICHQDPLQYALIAFIKWLTLVSKLCCISSFQHYYEKYLYAPIWVPRLGVHVYATTEKILLLLHIWVKRMASLNLYVNHSIHAARNTTLLIDAILKTYCKHRNFQWLSLNHSFKSFSCICASKRYLRPYIPLQ